VLSKLPSWLHLAVPPPPTRARIPSFQPAVEILTRVVRVFDHGYDFACKPLTAAHRLSLVTFKWIDRSINDLWSTATHIPEEVLLHRACRRLLAFVTVFFGTQLAVQLRVLCDSAVDLYHRYTDKLSMSFLVRVVDQTMETLRAEAREGPRSSGLSFYDWDYRMCHLTAGTDSI
jgi:hypothetical protein